MLLARHQERLHAQRHRYAQYVQRVASGKVSPDDAHDIVSETLSHPERWMAPDADEASIDIYFKRSLRDNTVVFLRRRDGQERINPATGKPFRRRRGKVIPLHAALSGKRNGAESGEVTAADVVADTTVDVEADVVDAGALRYRAELAEEIVRQAMRALAPLEQQVLYTRVQHPELMLCDIGEMLGLKERQVEYRLRTARQKFRAAVETVVVTMECQTTRATLVRPSGEATAAELANADAHCEDCVSCRVWAMAHAPTPERYRRVAALFPIPAVAAAWHVRLVQLAQRLWPFGETPAASEAVGGGVLALGGGAVKIACAVCAAGAIAGGSVVVSARRAKEPVDRPPARVAERPATANQATTPRPATLPVSPTGNVAGSASPGRGKVTPESARRQRERERARALAAEKLAAEREFGPRPSSTPRERQKMRELSRAWEQEFGPQPSSPPPSRPQASATPAASSAPAAPPPPPAKPSRPEPTSYFTQEFAP